MIRRERGTGNVKDSELVQEAGKLEHRTECAAHFLENTAERIQLGSPGTSWKEAMKLARRSLKRWRANAYEHLR